MLRLPGRERAGAERDVERFRRETRLCAQLHHPNIVRLIDSGEAGELLYAVFEFVPEAISPTFWPEGGLEPAEAVHLMMQVLDALELLRSRSGHRASRSEAGEHHGHQHRGAAQRDGARLRPRRARRRRERPTGGRLTVDGEYLGTPQYSAPEQLRGAPPTVLSDLYAWGLIFLECAHRRAGDRGRTPAEVVHAQLSLQPVPVPRSIASHPLGRLLRTATAKEPPQARASAERCCASCRPSPPARCPDARRWSAPATSPRPRRRSARRHLEGAGAAQRQLHRPPRAAGGAARVLATEPPPTVVALRGLGGIGKSQIALEYAYQRAAEYELVAWLGAEGADALAADYASLADWLGLPEKETRDQHARIEAVRTWLERHRRWLLIFDNAPTPQSIRAYLPHSPAGHAIATSRHQGWRSIGTGIAVDVLEPDEAAEFLTSRTGDARTPEAEHLCEELGRLPLALEEAAAYIEATGRSIATYRRLLESNRARLFDAGTPPADYPWTVRSTWEISLQRLEAEAPQAAQLLALCAYLAPDDMPLIELRQGLARLGDGALAPLTDELQLDRCIAALRRYSLVKLEENALWLHRLVQLVTRDRLPADERARWAAAALRLVEAVYPRSGLAGDVQPESGRLLPHALAVLGHVAELPQCDERAARLLSRTGVYMSATGVQARAVEHLTSALRLYDRHPELGDRERAAVLGNFALVQNARGELYEARDLLERALALHERLDGPDALSVGLALVTLAWVRRALGDLGEARAAGERGARIVGAHLGAAHPIVATLQSVTARALWELGELEAAGRLHGAVLAQLAGVEGGAHPMTAGAWLQSGVLAAERGDLERAVACAEQGVRVGTPAYGPDHPLVLSNLVISGHALLEGEDLEGARRVFERVVNAGTRTSARPHADITLSLPWLAEVQRRGGDPTLARRTAQQALATAGAIAGDCTRLLATICVVLGQIAADEGDLVGARHEHGLARALLETRIGRQHPAMLPVLNAQARVHLRAGAPAEARACGERVLSLAAGARLERHLEVAAALEAIAASLSAEGRRPEALDRLAQAEAIAVHRLTGRSARARRLAAERRRLADA